MSEHTFRKNYSKFVNSLIFIFPIVINSVKVAGDIVLFILAMMGIFIAISQRLSPFIIKDIKVFSYLTSSYFLAVCLSVLFSGKAMELAHFISRDLHFLFAPFIALALYKAEINVNSLLAGVKVGLIVLGVIVISQLDQIVRLSDKDVTDVTSGTIFANDFSSDNWSHAANASISGGNLNLDSTPSSRSTYYSNWGGTTGKEYLAEINVTAISGVTKLDDDGIGAGVGGNTKYVDLNSTGTQYFYFTRTGSQRFRFIRNSGSSAITSFNVYELKESLSVKDRDLKTPRVDRPSGVMNSAVFSSLAVSMFFIVFVFSQYEPFKHKMFTFLSLLSGIFVIVQSSTRGAWLSFLLLMVVYLFFLYKQNTKPSNSSKVFIALIIATVLSIVSLNQYDVNDRVYRVKTQVSNWFSDGQNRGSVSLRLIMYSNAIDNIGDVPFFGHGYRTSNLNLGKITPKSVENRIMELNHLHNAYLTNYYNGGTVLLGALLLLLFVPFRICIKAIIKNRDEPVFMAGALLTLGFASHGMFNALMGDVFMNAFYVFFLAIFLHLTVKLTKTS